jgi:hypothetical protein
MWQTRTSSAAGWFAHSIDVCEWRAARPVCTMRTGGALLARTVDARTAEFRPRRDEASGQTCFNMCACDVLTGNRSFSLLEPDLQVAAQVSMTAAMALTFTTVTR